MSKKPDLISLDDDDVVDEYGRPTKTVLRKIESQHAELSENVKQYCARHRSWLARLFPSRLDNVLADHQLNLAKTDFELNERILQLACTMKYDACREAADVWIKSMRVETRETFFRFVQDRTAKLQDAVEEGRIRFAEHMKDRYATAERYRDMPDFHARYLQSVQKDIEAHLSWLDGLLERFRSIVQERVVQYERSEVNHS